MALRINSGPHSHFKGSFESLGGEVDCIGSIKDLLHSICYSYQGGGKHCLTVHYGMKECCTFGVCVYNYSKVIDVVTHFALGTL